MEQGSKVIYKGKLKMLNKGTIGVIGEMYSDWCVIVYPQNVAYEDNCKNGWKPIKGAPNQVYAHSAKLVDVESAP